MINLIASLTTVLASAFTNSLPVREAYQISSTHHVILTKTVYDSNMTVFEVCQYDPKIQTHAQLNDFIKRPDLKCTPVTPAMNLTSFDVQNKFNKLVAQETQLQLKNFHEANERKFLAGTGAMAAVDLFLIAQWVHLLAVVPVAAGGMVSAVMASMVGISVPMLSWLNSKRLESKDKIVTIEDAIDQHLDAPEAFRAFVRGVQKASHQISQPPAPAKL